MGGFGDVCHTPHHLPVPAGDPRHPLPFLFKGMTDDEFDELVYLVAHLSDDRVQKLRAPDGGLDTVRVSADDPLRAEWGIQAKLHREQIKWSSCKESLDRAVAQWRADDVVFAFPRDLTAGQSRNFARHLVGRHPGVSVTWWGSTKLTAIMIGSDGGRAIAKRFFHAEDPADLVDRAARVGGPLRTAADLLEREAGVDDFLRTGDPHFDFQTTRRPFAPGEPPVPPGTAMRLEVVRDGRQWFFDAVPKSETASEVYRPHVVPSFVDPVRAAELAALVQKHGGRATLGEATLSFERVPAPFDRLLEELFKENNGTLVMRETTSPDPWPARVTVDTTLGRETLDFDLDPAEPGPDWDAILAGKRNGLGMECRFIWNHDSGSGGMQLHWETRRVTGTAAERARVWAFVTALHGDGVITFEDREGNRPDFRKELRPNSASDGLLALRDVYRDLAEIEAFSGAAFRPTPDEFSGDETYNIGFLANLLRTRRVETEIREVRGVLEPQAPQQLVGRVEGIVVVENVVVSLFDQEMHVADQVTRLPPMVVSSVSPYDDGGDEVVLVPADQQDATTVVEFHRPGTGRAPSS
jgi:hypothetical protein